MITDHSVITHECTNKGRILLFDLDMTQKQKEYIEFIEEFSGVKFIGDPNNNTDISEYINKNKEKASLASTSNWNLSRGYF